MLTERLKQDKEMKLWYVDEATEPVIVHKLLVIRSTFTYKQYIFKNIMNE